MQTTADSSQFRRFIGRVAVQRQQQLAVVFSAGLGVGGVARRPIHLVAIRAGGVIEGREQFAGDAHLLKLTDRGRVAARRIVHQCVNGIVGARLLVILLPVILHPLHELLSIAVAAHAVQLLAHLNAVRPHVVGHLLPGDAAAVLEPVLEAQPLHLLGLDPRHVAQGGFPLGARALVALRGIDRALDAGVERVRGHGVCARALGAAAVLAAAQVLAQRIEDVPHVQVVELLGKPGELAQPVADHLMDLVHPLLPGRGNPIALRLCLLVVGQCLLGPQLFVTAARGVVVRDFPPAVQVGRRRQGLRDALEERAVLGAVR